MPRPAPRRATLHAKYFTKRASPSSHPLALLANGTPRTPLPVRQLPHSRTYLQLLRLGQPLLHAGMRVAGTPAVDTGCWQSLPRHAPGPPRPCRTPAAIPCPAGESDASWFPTSGDACSTAGEPNGMCKNRTSAALALPFLSSAASAIGSYGISASTGSSSPSMQPERTAP